METKAHLQQLEHVKSHIIIGKTRVENFEVHIMHIFRDQAWNLRRGIADNIKEGNDVWAPSQILQDFDLSLDFLLLYRFEHFYDTLFVVLDIDTFKNL